MNFSLVGNGRPTEQRVVFVKESDSYPPLSQRESYTAAQQSAAQDTHEHYDCLVPRNCLRDFSYRSEALYHAVNSGSIQYRVVRIIALLT
jgi:hypothetical protein